MVVKAYMDDSDYSDVGDVDDKSSADEQSVSDVESDESSVASDSDYSSKRPIKRKRVASRRVVNGTPKKKKSRLLPRDQLPTPKTPTKIKSLAPILHTPLSVRTISSEYKSSPHQIAREKLHVSTIPSSIVCREQEINEIEECIEFALMEEMGSCVFVSGTPGTGKTLCIRYSVARLQEVYSFKYLEINGMHLTDPTHAYSKLWEAISGERVSPKHAAQLLESYFSKEDTNRQPLIVLMDELDQLVTRTQMVMYNFFNWPNMQHSKLIVLAVANTMDLPERILANKITSRMGYTFDQLVTIIKARLESISTVVLDDAINLASRRVANISGDARRALDICRRAVEIAEAASFPDTPTKRGKTSDKQANSGKVTAETIIQAMREMSSSPLQGYLLSLPLLHKLFLACLLLRMRRSGIAENNLGAIMEEMKMQLDIQIIPDLEKLKNILGLGGRLPNFMGMLNDCKNAGIIALDTRKGERHGKCALRITEEDLKMALRADDRIKSMVSTE